MFLSKDALDGESVPLAAARPTSGYGGRPSSSYGRPATGSTGVPSSGGGGAEEGEEVATPASAENMRAKMMQQRQRMLAKQKGNSVATNSMVMTNTSVPMNEASKNPTSPTAGASASPSGNMNASLLRGGSTISSTGGSMTETTTSMASIASAMEKENKEGLIAPESAPEKAYDQGTKEEQEKRRAARAQDLIDRGLGAEFNPVEMGEAANKPSFDIGSVHPSEWKFFLHNPAPKTAGMLQCRIIRDRSGISNRLHPKYTMEDDNGVFMMTAQKQMKNKTPNYSVMMQKNASKDAKDADSFLGKLRSDFLGIEWVAYGPGMNPSKMDPKLSHPQAMQLVRQELVAVQYTSSKWGNAKGPRKMNVVMPLVQANGERLVCRTLKPSDEGLISLSNNNSSSLVETYVNKSPKWNDKIGAYVLNFNKRVTEASVKNFQLCCSSDPDTVYLQFGRVGKDVFNIDFKYPLSPFQAFAVCLSSFDYKLGCE